MFVKEKEHMVTVAISAIPYMLSIFMIAFAISNHFVWSQDALIEYGFYTPDD